MRRLPWCIAVAALAACAQRVTPPSAAAVHADSLAVAALVRERLAAAIAGDTARWHAHIADDALWTGPGLRPARTATVIGSIADNRAVKPGVQQLEELAVHMYGDVAQATYVQLVQDAGQDPTQGKRFRKTDTYQRRRSGWMLIGAVEVAVPFRARRTLAAAAAGRLAGHYQVPGAEVLEVVALPSGRQFTMRGPDGIADTLLAESDSTLYEEGDPGTWVFTGAARGPATALLYRMQGARDIVLPRRDPR